MAEPKHTPGPWKAIEEHAYWLIRSPHHVYGLAQTTCHQMYYAEHAANARLMAAAPMLLKACRKLRRSDLPDREQPLWDEIQAAIAATTKE